MRGQAGETFTGDRNERNGCEHYDIVLRHFLNETNNFNILFVDHRLITLKRTYIYFSNSISCYT